LPDFFEVTTTHNASGHIAHASSDGDDNNDDDTNTLASPSCYRRYRRSLAAQLARLANSRHRPPAGTLRLLSQKQSVSFSILLVVSIGANLCQRITLKNDGGSTTGVLIPKFARLVGARS
jgi:hypothetical protein